MTERVWTDISRSDWLKPVLTLAIIAVLLFAKPLVRNEVLTLRDHSDYFQPLRLFTGQELRRGHLPLWNPYNASGEPWLANPQTGVFYPPAWIFLFVPFARAYILFLAFHVALLGCGTLVLLRRLASPAAALVGALSLMLCGPSLSLLDVSNTLATFAWIPLVVWCALALAPPVVCAGVIALSFLAGEPFFAALGALMFVILRRRNIVDVALTAFGLSAIQLLPFVEMLRGSDRAGNVAGEEILRDSLPLSDWIHVLFGGASHQQFVPVVYVGVVAAILAIVAIAFAFRTSRVQVLIAVVVLAAIIAAGSTIAPVAYLLTHLPLVLFRYPSRMLPLGALALAALAAIGYDIVAQRVRYWWLPIVLAALIIVDLTPRVAPLVASAPFNPHPTPYDVRLARDSKLVRLLSGRNFDRRAWIGGYMNLFDRRFDAWTAAPVVSQTYARMYEDALAHPDRLDAISAGYVLSDRPLHNLRRVARARNVVMYRNFAAFPLAYWRGDDGAIRPPSLLAFTTTAVHVTIDAPRDGAVVVTQQDASGWRATIDDVDAPTLRRGAFRVVRVKQGRHAIAWRYRPTSLIVGAIVTAIALLRFLSAFFVKR